jgi:16S rRNA (adenine1518-N6/adenine1519-N6)-dimethyltransferase
MPRRLGQHFLRDPAILDRIVGALYPAPDDLVLEIGPGEGTLTRRLAPRVARVVAIEKDKRLVERLRGVGRGERFPPLPDNISVVLADALDVEWSRAVPLPTPDSPWKVIGNIPYNITSPLIEKALEPPLPSVIVFLVQKEVADRLTAVPGSKAYGALTVGVQAVVQADRLFTVKAGAFNPPPKVDSAVVRLTPLSAPLVDDADRAPFRRFVVGLFGQRRKQLARSLRDVAALDKDEAALTVARAGADGTSRVENLAPAALVRLFEEVRRT